MSITRPSFLSRAHQQAVLLILTLAFFPLLAADNPQLLAEFQKTNPAIKQIHIIAETPLLVAASGPKGWGKGELLGIFAHRGDQLLQVSMLPNDDFPTSVWVDRASPDSITFGLADPELRLHSDNLKIFFDPKTWFPRRIVRFAPVRVRRISLVAGVLTLVGTDGKNDFTAREHNGAWRVTTAPAAPLVPVRPVQSVEQVTPMPGSWIYEFRQARPARAKQVGDSAIVEEQIGPYQKVATKLWIGKTFVDSEDAVGVGDIGNFDTATQRWTFLHIPEMADWSASALLVETDAIWVGLVQNTDGPTIAGGLLRYDRMTRKAKRIPLPETIDKIIRVGKSIYCGATNGFAIVDHQPARDHIQRFEFSPQLDGAYTITPAT